MTQDQFFARYKYDPDTDMLGGGGFGKVYKAFDETRNRNVAIKIAEVKKGQENLSLMNEVKLAASLTEHKNIAHYENCHRFKSPYGTYDYGILQHYPDGNLSQLITNKKLSAAEKEQLAKGIISGLQHLHNNNIVHRDLKSSNILIARGYNGEYVPKIADFGLSKQFTETEKSYFSNSFAGGSLLYVAPEQLEGKEIRKNVDLWSLGVVLYELFLGDTPFRTKEINTNSEIERAEIIRKIKNADIPTDINTLSEPWKSIILNCLIADPNKRIKNIEDIMFKLDMSNKVTYTLPDIKEERKDIKVKSDWKRRIFKVLLGITVLFGLLVLYGEILPFNSTPKVRTILVTEVTDKSFNVKAELLDDGGLFVYQKGFIYSQDPEPKLGDFDVTLYGSNDFEAEIGSLEESTTYFVRAFAKNNKGIAYGNILQFKTKASIKPATLSIGKIQRVTYSSVDFELEISDNGGGTIKESGVLYGACSNILKEHGERIEVGNLNGVYQLKISSLMPNTNYYWLCSNKNMYIC